MAPAVLKAESKNLPAMVKEFAILSNPGLLLGFSILVVRFIRRRQKLERFAPTIAIIILVGALALVFAYSMLVFDSRYLLPLLPLVIAFGARFLVSDTLLKSSFFRPLCWGLVSGGVILFAAYRSSPFRVQTRDFKPSVIARGPFLAHEPAKTVVSIGSGPFPERGVGWEAGYKAAYFAGKRLIATDEIAPSKRTSSGYQRSG